MIREPTRNHGSDDAVSEVIGYVIVLSIVLLSMGYVLNYSPTVIQDSQDFEHAQNTQQTFSIVQNNLDEVVRRDVPARATEIRLYNADLHTENDVWINVTLGDQTTSSTRMSSLTYVTEDNARVVYENGAVIRRGGDNSGMLYEPSWTFNDDVYIINSVITRGDNRVSGDGTTLIEGTAQDVNTSTGFDTTVNVTIDSANAMAWESYFKRLDLSYNKGPDVIPNGGNDDLDRFVVEFDADQRIIHTEHIINTDVQ